MTSPPRQPTRYVMVGGFLGAGKTTALARMGEILANRGVRAGLITNDQSSGLVDTALLRKRGFAVEEIAGGCFCCRFPSLQQAATRLSEAARPDVFLAEPVGSCTDLVATVSYPLRRMYGSDFSVAPLSVLVDPVRAARILDLVPGRSFSPKVLYVYRKQLEEAHHIVINKIDSIDAELRADLQRELNRRYPRATLHACSARTGEGVESWLDQVLEDGRDLGHTMDIDYDAYADGEALLGWLNATLHLESDVAFDASSWLLQLAERMRRDLGARGIETAHVKMTLDPGDLVGSIAAASFVRSDSAAELRESLPDPIQNAELILNVRAEAEPGALEACVTTVIEAVSRPGLRLTTEHQESFRPSRPVPTHRISVAGPN